jgi:hypothetical protein
MEELSTSFGAVPSHLQMPFDFAVVIPTILRPTLKRAVSSVFRQRSAGRIQILIGVDQAIGDRSVLDEIQQECPAHCALSIIDLGYSTSQRHGGLHPGASGGVLRTILSYAANSRAIAYLDDDNWFGEDHLRTLGDALSGNDWAFSYRWFVEQATGTPLCIDEWESVGPSAGVFCARFGGFVDPNCLMIDKLKCEPVLRWWCFPIPGDPRAMSEDRLVFDYLMRYHSCGATGQATSFYVIQPEDGMHPHRLRWIQEKAGPNLPNDTRPVPDQAA